MVLLTSLTSLLFAAQYASAAFNPATDRNMCNKNRHPCLTSFVWCGVPADSAKGCTYPQNAYPWYNRDFPSNPAALLLGSNYNLSWQNFDPNYPIQIRWDFGTSQTVYDTARRGNGTWIKTITNATSYPINFNEIANEFPTSTSNLTRLEVIGLAGTGLSTFTVSQPDKQVAAYETTGDFSDSFIVFDDYARIYLNTQADITRTNLEHKWKLGVGIGVGLGVPLLMAASFVLAWVIKGRSNKTPKAKKFSESS